MPGISSTCDGLDGAKDGDMTSETLNRPGLPVIFEGLSFRYVVQTLVLASYWSLVRSDGIVFLCQSVFPPLNRHR